MKDPDALSLAIEDALDEGQSSDRLAGIADYTVESVSASYLDVLFNNN